MFLSELFFEVCVCVFFSSSFFHIPKKDDSISVGSDKNSTFT